MAVVIVTLDTLTKEVLEEMQFLEKKDRLMVVPTPSLSGIPFELFTPLKQLKCEIEFTEVTLEENNVALPFLLGYLFASNKEMVLLGFSPEVQNALPEIAGNPITFVKNAKELAKSLEKASAGKAKAERPRKSRVAKAASKIQEEAQEEAGKASYPKAFVDLMNDAKVSSLELIAESIIASSDYKFGLPFQLDIRRIEKEEKERVLKFLEGDAYEKMKELLIKV